MKKKFTSMLSRCILCAVAVLSSLSIVSCSSDNDEPKPVEPQTFNGNLTTSIPSMPSFEALVCDDVLTLTWLNPEQTSVTLELGAFNISVATPMGDRSYEIGTMTITDVPCVKSANKITIPEYEFECMAGNYATTGKVSGVLENDVLTATFEYKPGSMPFMVKSVFKSK